MYQPDPEMMMPMQAPQQPMWSAAFWTNYIQNAYNNAALARQNRQQMDAGRTDAAGDVPVAHPPADQMPINKPGGGHIPNRVPVRQPVLMDSRVPGIQPIRPRFGALPYGGYTNA